MLTSANGNLTNLWSSTSGGVTNVYQYDPLNRLTNVIGQISSLSQYGYDAAGNLQSMSYGNGITSLYQYDTLNRLTNCVWKLNASPLASFFYQLGQTGNRTNLSETVNGTGRNYQWQYDNLYRLTNEIFNASSNVLYGYDPVSNRTNRNSSVGGLANQVFSFNTNDWLSTDKYDNNGNTTNSANIFYQYDAMNHITNAGGILMTYDGDGNRASKTVGTTTTYYLLDDRNPSGYVQVLEEYANSSLATMYNYGLELINQRTLGSQASTNYFIFDGHGSTRLLTDIGGTVQNAFAYDAYGNLIASNSAPQTAYLYCGQQRDSNLGLYLNRSRYLNVGTGRFWTMDKDEGNNEDPLSLHKYIYCQGNPEDSVDLSGHENIPSQGVTLSGISSLATRVVGVTLFTLENIATKFPTLTKIVIGGQIFLAWSASQQDPSQSALYLETGGAAADLAFLKQVGQDIKESFYIYKGLNQLGGPMGASGIITKASITKSTPPTVNPVGFYSLPAYNRARAHLIAGNFGGGSSEPRNIVAMYQDANQLMWNYEYQVKKAAEAGEKIFYVANPVYVGQNQIPSEIEMMAEGDKGFSLHAYIVNTPKP